MHAFAVSGVKNTDFSGLAIFRAGVLLLAWRLKAVKAKHVEIAESAIRVLDSILMVEAAKTRNCVCYASKMVGSH